MRAVIQRVRHASVTVDDRTVGEIGRGVVVLLGISTDDDYLETIWMSGKIATLRMFPDDEEKMNLSLKDAGGEALVVSQFTLYGDARKGRRPSFIRAERGDKAKKLYERTVEELEMLGIRCATGEFGAMMQVHLVNDGPVTILLDSDKTF